MAEYIEREAACKIIDRIKHNFTPSVRQALDSAIACVSVYVPTADVVEVRHGEWIDTYGGKYSNQHYECSLCKKPALYKPGVDELNHFFWDQYMSDYCPHCGAKMDGKGDAE